MKKYKKVSKYDFRSGVGIPKKTRKEMINNAVREAFHRGEYRTACGNLLIVAYLDSETKEVEVYVTTGYKNLTYAKRK